jgi:ABC-type transport system substrate-binding protein
LFDGRTITNTPTTNFAFYNNPEVNRLLDLAATNITLATRCLLYGQAEELIVRDAPFIFLGYPKFFALKQPWVKGRLIEPLWPFRLDRVWIE